MPRRSSLTFDELAQIWTAAERGEGPDAVWQRLTKRVDIKPVRAAYRVFERLQEDQREGRPILTLSVADDVPPELAAKGVYPIHKLARHARATGYGLREPGLLRLMAVHNHMTILRHGALPAPTGIPAPQPPSYPPGHLGALMRVRDAMHFSVSEPWYVLIRYFHEPAHAPDPQFSVQEEEDLAFEMLREHTQDHHFWSDLVAWQVEIRAYERQARDLVAEIERYVLSDTGMERAYVPGGGETFGPQDPPKITKWFILGPMDYLLRVRKGALEGGWKFKLEPFGQPEDRNYRLDAGYGSKLQTIAIGPLDRLERARNVARTVIARLREPSAIPALAKMFERCQALARKLEAAKQELSEAVLNRGRCWACEGDPQDLHG